MAADNYYLLPSYGEALRDDELNNFFGAKATTRETVRCREPYTLDRSTIILAGKVCTEFMYMRVWQTVIWAEGTWGMFG